MFALAFLVFILYWSTGWPVGEPTYLQGVVASTGPVSVASMGGGGAQGLSIELSNGRTVVVVHGPHARLLSPGDSVRVARQANLLAAPDYEIVEDR